MKSLVSPSIDFNVATLNSPMGCTNGLEKPLDAPKVEVIHRKKKSHKKMIMIGLVTILLISGVMYNVFFQVPTHKEEKLLSSFTMEEDCGVDGVVEIYDTTIQVHLDESFLATGDYANNIYIWIFFENSSNPNVPSIWGDADVLITCVLHESIQTASAYITAYNLDMAFQGVVLIDDDITISFSRIQLGLREDIKIQDVHMAVQDREKTIMDTVKLFDNIVAPDNVIVFEDDLGECSDTDIKSASIYSEEDVSYISLSLSDAFLFVPSTIYHIIDTDPSEVIQTSSNQAVRPEEKPSFIPQKVIEPFYGISMKSDGEEIASAIFNHKEYEGDVNNLSIEDNKIIFTIDSYRIYGCDELILYNSYGSSDIIEINVVCNVPTKSLGDQYNDDTSRVLLLKPSTGSSNATIEAILEKYNYNYTSTTTFPTDIKEMLSYEFIIVSWGDSTTALTSAQKDILWQYVNNTGHLWIEGGEIGYTHSGDGNFTKYVLFAIGWNSDDPDPAPGGDNYFFRESRELLESYHINDTVTFDYDNEYDNDNMVFDTSNITGDFQWYDIDTYATVHGRSNQYHIYSPLEIDLINDNDREKIVTNIIEHLTPNVIKGYQHTGITVDGSKIDWIGTAPDQYDMIVEDKQEVIWLDSINDDTAYGYSYPTPSDRWGTDTLDLKEFRCTGNEGNMYLLFEFENLTNNQSYDNGFSEIAISFYFGDGKITQSLNNTNTSFIHPVETSWFISGENVSVYQSNDGLWNYTPTYELSANTTTNIIEFSFPISTYCSSTAGEDVSFYCMIGAYDDNDNFLNAQGKGNSTDPNWYDSLFTADINLLFNSDIDGVVSSNAEDGLGGVYVDTSIRWAQSFFIADQTEVGAVRIKANDVGTNSAGGGRLRVAIQSDNGSKPSGTIITSNEMIDFSPDIFEWGRVDFTSTAVLEPNTRYWLILRCTDSPTNGYLLYTGDNSTEDTNSMYGSGPTWTNQTDYDLYYEVIPENETFVHSSHQSFTFGYPVYINEVSSYGSENDTEWIELYNGGTAPVNISGWSLNNKVYDLYTFDNVTIGAFGYVTLLIVDQFNTSTNSSTEIYWKASTEFLNDTSDILLLNNTFHYHHNQDTLVYGGSQTLPRDSEFSGTIPTAPGLNGSLSRYPNGRDTNNGSDWDREHPTGYMIVTQGGYNQVIPFMSNIIIVAMAVIMLGAKKKKRGVSI